MRIPSANIPTQSSNPTTTPATAVGRAIDRRQSLASDTYARNSQPQQQPVIDAEYVEFYSPSTKIFSKERHNLDGTIEPESSIMHAGTSQTAAMKSPAVGKYQQLADSATPLPGSLIDIFA